MKMLAQTFSSSWMSSFLFLLAMSVPLEAVSQSVQPISNKKSTTKTNQKPAATTQKQSTTNSRQSGSKNQAEVAPKTFSGTWKLKKNKKLNDQRMASIEQAVGSLPRFQQGFARKMLTNKTAPPSSLKIADSGAKIELANSGFKVTVPTDGQPVTAKTDEGSATLQAGKRDGKLIVVTKSSKATMTKVYHLSADGKTLTQQVHIQSKNLSLPIQFSNQFEQ